MSDEHWIVPRNWSRFQHYKDRAPAWIKNYIDLLSRDEYVELTLTQRGMLHGIWMLYAEKNKPLSSTRSRHLLASNKGESRHFLSNLEVLEQAGFIELSLAKPYQVASLETEKEKEPPKPPLNGGTDKEQIGDALAGSASPSDDDRPFTGCRLVPSVSSRGGFHPDRDPFGRDPWPLFWGDQPTQEQLREMQALSAKEETT